MSCFKRRGYRVILVNSNPATIMTDKEIADKVYIEPLTHDFIARIIRKEQPDALLPTLGGQTGLNMAIQLHDSGVLALIMSNFRNRTRINSTSGRP